MKTFHTLILFSLLTVTACGSSPRTLATQTATAVISVTAPQTKTATPPSTPTQTPTSTSTPPSSETPTQTPSPTPTQMGGSAHLIVTLSRKAYRSLFPDLKGETNLFVVDIDGNGLMPITNLDGRNGMLQGCGGDNLNTTSPNGQLVMAWSYNKTNEASMLHIVGLDGSSPVTVTTPLSIFCYIPSGYKPAMWLPDGRIAFVGEDQGERFVFLSNPNGAGQVKLSQPLSDRSQSPLAIAGYNGERIYWVSSGRYRTTGSVPTILGVWWTQLDGSDQQPLLWEKNLLGNAVISPNASRMAWTEYGSSNGQETLFVANLDGTDKVTIPEGGGNLINWSPDGTKLYFASYSKQDNKNVNNVWFAASSSVIKLPDGINSVYGRWSPDSRMLLFEGDKVIVDVGTMKVIPLFSQSEFLTRLDFSSGLEDITWPPDSK